VADLLDPAVKANKSALERHHLFPRGYLAKLGTTAVREVNQIANFALVEWPDNIAISDQAPATYFPKIVAEKHLPPQEIEQLRYWHALPEDWVDMAYEEFLAARRRLMAQVVWDGFSTLVIGGQVLSAAG
jgi:hypothetical protein